ncbi:hypothetical protein [Amycolatopsis jiangsuensis]|uniref:PE family protein n=1 Tax=Amycolatopsis jiangsuensis TaxID=1181879 RepID=A0A840ITW4_9PSEU|nr:hypothetical protein [Amycolatopsis jiangsuensis]MBB4685310.1 hypothetical protein [Amycolatopsis jiangsuensis]
MWEDVQFSVLDPGGWSTAPNGFALQPDEAKQVLKELRGYEDRLLAMHQKAQNLCSMAAPSEDPATMAMHVARVGDGSGKLGAFSYGGGHIDLQLAYVRELIDRIAKALTAIGETDQAQAAALPGADTPSGHM